MLNEFLDFVSPRHGVSGFRVPNVCKLVSRIEVVTEILAGIYARLDQLSFLLVRISRSRGQRPTEYTSVPIMNKERNGTYGR